MSRMRHALRREPPPSVQWVIRFAANLIGAAGAAYFAYVTFAAYLQTHRPIGFLFSAQQMVVVVAYLVRRPARVVTRRFFDWVLAFGGTFAPVLLRPDGLHPSWGLQAGLVVQFCGVTICLWSLLTLGRSFGFAAADRGLVQRGPYRIVRHPIYASYLVGMAGYLFESPSPRNILLFSTVIGFQVARIHSEEQCLVGDPEYRAYRARVRYRLVPPVF